uniref:E3 ubiquitin-protein ligase listerin n=1 Tax=Rhipicephalus appendiculatus TaxID=34631 RepID=A0A131YUS9_RHIAP
MGGNKKAPRTKGNTRPSSSGRSAQLLSASGASGLTGFVGFTSLAGDCPAYIPPTGQHVIDDADSSVDSDFRMVMRKLTKRDQTTRLKALQELLDLVKEKDVELVKGALPFWPRLYNKLSLDNDRRVREATHRVHELICQRVRRDLAPHTKALIGAWLVSQSDPFAPAATAARAAFEAAFSSEKQIQVFQFFSQELFSHLNDVILQQTVDTVPDSKELSPEEREAKYHRWLSCALLGLKMVLEYLSPLPESGVESLDSILKEPKFWKMAKHKEIMVRKSWYSLASSLSRVDHVCKTYGAKLCSHTLGSLAENDPVVAVPIWEAALSVVSAVQDCWTHVDARKAVLPQLWKVLKNGGFGSAVHIYPNLLPFLSLVPAEVVGVGVQFYKLFFDSFREGLLSQKVQASMAECNAVVQAFMECLRYVLIRHLAPDENAKAVRSHILEEQLVEVLRVCLTDSLSRLSGTRLYYEVASLHAFVLQKILSGDTEPAAKTSYQECLELIWSRLLKLSLEIASMSPPNVVLVRRLTKLICAIHSPPASPRSQMKVTLVAPEDANSAVPSKRSSLVLDGRTSPLEAFPTTMAHTTKICAEVLKRARTNPGSAESLVYTEAASEVLRVSSSSAFVEAVLTEMGVECGAGDSAVVEFFGLFRSVVSDAASASCKDRLEEYYGHVANCLLVASVSASATAAKVAELFNNTVLDNEHLLAVLLEKSLDCWKSHAGIQEWLRSNDLAEKLLQLSQKLVPSSSSESDLIWRSLRASLEMGNLSEPLISLSNLSSILSTLRKTLQNFTQAEGKQLVKAVDFVCEITNTLFSSYEGCCNLPESEEFVLALFLLDCQSTLSSSPETREKVCWSWQQGISMIVKARGGFLAPGGLLQKIASTLNSMLLSRLSCDKRQGLVRCCCRFLESIFAAIPKEEQDPVALLLDPTVSLVLESILPTSQQWEKLVSDTCLLELLAVHLEHPEDHPLYTTQDYLSKQASNQCLDQAHLADVAGFAEAVFDHMLASESEAESKPLKSSSLLLKCAPFLILARCFPHRVFTVSVEDKEGTEGQSALNAAMETFSNDVFDSIVNKALSGEKLWQEALVYFLKKLREDGIARRICDSHYIAAKDNFYGQEKKAELLVVRSLLPFMSQNNIEEVFLTAVGCIRSWEPELGWGVAVDLLGLACKALEGLDSGNTESINEAVVSVLYWLQGTRGAQPKLYLRDEDAGLSEDQFEWSRMACHFYLVILKQCPQALTSCNWDFVLLSIATWNQKFNWRRAVELFSTREIIFTCELLSSLLQVAHVTDKAQPIREQCKLPEGFDVEWEEFYTHAVFSVLIPGFIDIAQLSTCPNEVASVLLKKLASALEFASEKSVIKFVEGFQNQEQNAASLNTLLSKLTPLATSKSLALQLGAHTLLQKIVPTVAREEAQGIEKQDSDETSRSPPEPLLTSLLEMGHIVEVLLLDFDVGDCCLVEANTDSYTYTLGYLLSWLELLAFFGASPAEARSEYASYLQEEGLLSSLLQHLFCLMPSNVSLGSKGNTMFTEPVKLSPQEVFSSTKLQHVACQVYLDTICKLPALVRAWWNSQNKRVMDHVEKFTSNHVTSVISSREIQAVQNADVSLENMTVKGRPTAREVVATYTIEEVAIELVVKLPANHPLGVVTIDGGRRVGVSQSQWRHWLLQLTTFLTHQNGSILDGLALWKRNVDKRFEGVEECMICFYVLHGATCQLPKLSCRTCKKRFHSACLFKWFNTSNNSTCPLCRNVF